MKATSFSGICLSALALCSIAPRGPCVTRYVSPDGGDVAPYTSPQTAARRIGDALDVAEAYDTVLVAPGSYCGERLYVKRGTLLEGQPMGAEVFPEVLSVGEECLVKGLTFSTAVMVIWYPNVLFSHCTFRDIAEFEVFQPAVFEACSFYNVSLACDNYCYGTVPIPVFLRCNMVGVGLGAGYSFFCQCWFIDTQSTAGSAVFVECVAGRESGFTGGNPSDRAVLKHCTVGYLRFEGFSLVEECIIRYADDVRPKSALHNCILVGEGTVSPELAANNNRYAQPIFAGWIAYEDSGVHVAPDGDADGDGTQENPLPLVSSAISQTYDYHLVAGSPGMGEASDGRNIGAYPDAEPVPRGTDSVVVNIAPGEYVDSLPDLYRRGHIHMRRRGQGRVRIKPPREGSFYADEAVTLEGITFARGTVEAYGRIVDCVFQDSPHSGLRCGGAEEAPTLISRCRFEGNAEAGGLVWRDRVAIFENCVFTANQWGISGFGLAMATNCTVSRNDSAVSGNVDMTNSIVWQNHRLSDGLPSGLVATYSLIQGGCSGEGNIESDPLFIDSEEGDIRLRPDSPCIDAGFNSPELTEFDIAGMHRIMFGGKSLTVDMGAYEFYINNLDPVPGSDDAVFTWSSLADKTYSIFYTDDLLNWHTAIASFPSFGNQTTSWTDDGALTGLSPLLAPKRFYRILENP